MKAYCIMTSGCTSTHWRCVCTWRLGVRVGIIATSILDPWVYEHVSTQRGYTSFYDLWMYEYASTQRGYMTPGCTSTRRRSVHNIPLSVRVRFKRAYVLGSGSRADSERRHRSRWLCRLRTCWRSSWEQWTLRCCSSADNKHKALRQQLRNSLALSLRLFW